MQSRDDHFNKHYTNNYGILLENEMEQPVIEMRPIIKYRAVRKCEKHYAEDEDQ